MALRARGTQLARGPLGRSVPRQTGSDLQIEERTLRLENRLILHFFQDQRQDRVTKYLRAINKKDLHKNTVPFPPVEHIKKSSAKDASGKRSAQNRLATLRLSERT